MRVGSVCYATSQGLGHLAKSFYDAGVITDMMIYRHPHGEQRSPTNFNWYPPDTHVITTRDIQGKKIERFLDDIDVMLFFETPFDWNFPNRCRERGVKTVIIPMYEWFLQRPPHQFDLFINPSLLDQEYFPDGIHIPVPVEGHITWTLRNAAKRFLHNAGHIGSRNHKGTLELLRAMEFVTSPIELTVRCQDTAGIRRLWEAAPSCESDKRITVTAHTIPRGQLFPPDFDVYIAPEKYNGLSLPLQEAWASGMMVMTTNRFPANTWLPTDCLIPVSDTHRVQTMGGHLEFEESIVDPHSIASTIDNWYGKAISYHSLSGSVYRESNNWSMLKHCYIEALESVL